MRHLHGVLVSGLGVCATRHSSVSSVGKAALAQWPTKRGHGAGVSLDRNSLDLTQWASTADDPPARRAQAP